MLPAHQKTKYMHLMPCAKSMDTLSAHLLLDDSGTELDIQWLGCTTPRLRDAVARMQRQLGVQLPLIINCLARSSDHPDLHCDESYQLRVDPKNESITVNANTEWGILRSLATLSQLVEYSGNAAHPTSIESCNIKDAPAFTWRGLMLDPARHFLPIKVIEETLDLMFLFKLNVLHLHLTDDQGFRFFSPTYPELAEIGGEGNYYTTDQLKGLVQSASARGIRIIPELDIPGHCTSWLAAKPEWGAGALDKKGALDRKGTINAGHPSHNFGGHKACLDPGNPEVYKAIAILLDELAEVFPDEYVHLGGDEVNPEWWNSNATVQEYMQSQQLDTVSNLQNHFMTRIARLAHDLGKKVVGWDEILHPDLSRSTVIQSWRTAKYRDIALESGFDCIFSSAYYLDLFYPADTHWGFIPDAEPLALQEQEAGILDDARLAHIQGLNRWLANFHDKAANKMPGSNKKTGQVLGGEACMWSELVTEELLHTRIWSRMPVIAERLWSGSTASADVYPRLEASWECMNVLLGINIYEPIEQFIASFNASINEIHLLRVLLQNLEPVKGYARLLGDQADARVSGTEVSANRPYNCDTPLNRIVDLLPPESLSARKTLQILRNCTDNSARDSLKIQAKDWCEQLLIVRKLMVQDSRLAEILPLSESLALMGDLLNTWLSTKNTAENSTNCLTTKEIANALMLPACELVLPITLGLSEV